MVTTHAKGQPFPGLELTDADRAQLRATRRKKTTERTWRRIRILVLLDQGRTLAATGDAVGCHPREVRRVGWRYLEKGLESALTDDARPHPDKLLNKKTESAHRPGMHGPS